MVTDTVLLRQMYEAGKLQREIADHFGVSRQAVSLWVRKLGLQKPSRRKSVGRLVRSTIEQRFWGNVNKTTGCWVWVGKCDKNGYGRLGRLYAHRFSYTLHHAPIPNGMYIDHLCFNRRCVNPAHLRIVTPSENGRRKNPELKGKTRKPRPAKTHCKKGHPFDQANTYVWKNGARSCRECHRQYETRRRERLKASKQKEPGSAANTPGPK